MFSPTQSAYNAADDENTLNHPHQLLPKILRSRRKEFVEPRQIKIRVGTWNVAARSAEAQKDISEWIMQSESSAKYRPGPEEKLDPEEVDVYAIGLQEVIDINATQSYINYIDPTIAAGWISHVQAALPKGYECIFSQQQLGILLLIFVSKRIKPEISCVAQAQVGTGFLGYLSNKGAVSARLVIAETTRLVFVNCHLAALTSAVDRRNWDANEIEKRTYFPPVDKNVIGIDDEGASTEEEGIANADAVIWFGDLNYRIDVPNEEIRSILAPFLPTDFPPILPPSSPVTADSAGAFSFNSPPASKRQSVAADSTPPEVAPGAPKTLEKALAYLLEKDQLYIQQKFGRVLDGYTEGHIKFLPTYRYELGTIGHWDASEKQRAPSWCDRILFKVKPRKRSRLARAMSEPKRPIPGSFNIDEVVFENDDDESLEMTVKKEEDSDDDELIMATDNIALDTPPRKASIAEASIIQLEQHFYTSHQSITSSDHKPVSSLFTLRFPGVIAELRNAIQQQITKDLDKIENERRPIVTMIFEHPEGITKNTQEGIISFGKIHMSEEKRRMITVANTGMVKAEVRFVPRPSSDMPGQEELSKRWLRLSFIDSSGNETLAAVDKTITIDPGDTVTIKLAMKVANSLLLDSLNRGKETLDDLLVLRVEGGRDVFLMISAEWLRTCYGRSVRELVAIPENAGGARKYFDPANSALEEELKSKTLWSAPRELYRMTDFLLEKIRCLVDPKKEGNHPVDLNHRYLTSPGWPFDASTWSSPDLTTEILTSFQDSLDEDAPFNPPAASDEALTEHMSHMLLRFFRLLPEGVIPASYYEKVIRANGKKKLSEQLLESLPPMHANIFIYLTGFLSEMISLLSTPRLPPPPSEIEGDIQPSILHPNKEVVADRIAGVFAEVLIQRPRAAGGSKRAEEKIRGFLLGFVDL